MLTTCCATSGRFWCPARSTARSASAETAKRAGLSTRKTLPVGKVIGATRCDDGAGEKKPLM